MPSQPREHVLMEESLRAFVAALPPAWSWQEPTRDYGVDVRVEVFEAGSATGLSFWVQLKGTDEPDLRKALRQPFEVTALNYMAALSDPVLLVRYHAPSSGLYGTWLHRQDVVLKRAAQKSKTLGWSVGDAFGPATPDGLAAVVRRWRRFTSTGGGPPTASLSTAPDLGTDAQAVSMLFASALSRSGAGSPGREPAAADAAVRIGRAKAVVDLPVAQLRIETVRAGTAAEAADNAVVALAAGLASAGRASDAVALVMEAPRAGALANDDLAGRLAAAFGEAGAWRDASDLSLDCLTGPPGRELLGRLLGLQPLLTMRDLPHADARHVADNLAELARREQDRGENPGASLYSLGNWLFGIVRDYPAALDAYLAAARARSDYERQPYWLAETAAAYFETGAFDEAAALYAQAAAAGGAAGEPTDASLAARRADCLAHAGRPGEALAAFRDYERTAADPHPVWVLKRHALEADADDAPPDDAPADDGAPAASRSDAVQDGVADVHTTVHPGVGGRALLDRWPGAVAEGDTGTVLAVLLLACAFPAPGRDEPWDLLLTLVHGLAEAPDAHLAMQGLFDTALDAAWHRRGDRLVEGVLRTDGPPPPQGLLDALAAGTARPSGQQDQHRSGPVPTRRRRPRRAPDRTGRRGVLTAPAPIPAAPGGLGAASVGGAGRGGSLRLVGPGTFGSLGGSEESCRSAREAARTGARDVVGR